MPTWTQDQLNAMGAVVAGTHDRLDPTPRVQPGYNVNDVYAGILPSASPPTLTANRPVSGPTPAQLAAIHAVPGNSYMRPVGVPNYDPTRPNGTQGPDTGSYGRASGSMLEPLFVNYPDVPKAPNPTAAASPMEDALIAAGVKPGVPMAQQKVAGPAPQRADPGWLKTSRQLAQVGFRQGAIQAAKPPPAAAPARPSAGPMVRASPPRAPTPQANPAVSAALAGRQAPQPTMISTSGYTYSAPGVKSGVTPWAGVLTPSQQYAAANKAGQIAALQRQAAGQASGAQTPVQTLQSQGLSAANAYAAANAQAAARARANASNPSSQSSGGGGDWFTSARGW